MGFRWRSFAGSSWPSVTGCSKRIVHSVYHQTSPYPEARGQRSIKFRIKLKELSTDRKLLEYNPRLDIVHYVECYSNFLYHFYWCTLSCKNKAMLHFACANRLLRAAITWYSSATLRSTMQIGWDGLGNRKWLFIMIMHCRQMQTHSAFWCNGLCFHVLLLKVKFTQVPFGYVTWVKHNIFVFSAEEEAWPADVAEQSTFNPVRLCWINKLSCSVLLRC